MGGFLIFETVSKALDRPKMLHTREGKSGWGGYLFQGKRSTLFQMREPQLLKLATTQPPLLLSQPPIEIHHHHCHSCHPFSHCFFRRSLPITIVTFHYHDKRITLRALKKEQLVPILSPSLSIAGVMVEREGLGKR